MVFISNVFEIPIVINLILVNVCKKISNCRMINRKKEVNKFC